MTGVPRRKVGVNLLRCRGDDEIGDADARPMTIPAASQLPGSTCDLLVDRNPAHGPEELLGARPLGAE